MADQNRSITGVNIPDSTTIPEYTTVVNIPDSNIVPESTTAPESTAAVNIPDSTTALSRLGDANAAAVDNVGGGPIRMDAEQIRVRTQPLFAMFTVLKYIVPLALALAALEYEGNTVNVFDENPIPIWGLYVSTWLFFIIVGALKANIPRLNNSISFDILIYVGTVSGLTSIMSSISIFIPRRYSFLPLLPVVAVAAAVLAWHMLHYLFNYIRVRVANCWGSRGSSSSITV